MHSPLKIRLFGFLEVECQGRKLAGFTTRKARSLFAFLALNAETLHARETLSGLFWPESSETAARKRLRTELWQIRRTLSPFENGESVVATDNGSVGWSSAAVVWIDRREYEQKLAPLTHPQEATLTPLEARQFAEAVALYRGDLLEGLYDDWCVEARGLYRARQLAALEKLMAYHEARGEWEAAICYGEEALRFEPLAEHVHRGLMLCHWQKRNRTAALIQFSRCAAILEEELGVEPMPETVSLCREIRRYHE